MFIDKRRRSFWKWSRAESMEWAEGKCDVELNRWPKIKKYEVKCNNHKDNKFFQRHDLQSQLHFTIIVIPFILFYDFLAPDTRLQNDPMICIEIGTCKKERERIDFWLHFYRTTTGRFQPIVGN